MPISLPSWFPRSIFGLILAGLYLAIAIWAVALDRKESGGGWITLHGMASFVITLPASALGEWLNLKADYRRNVDMAIVMAPCVLIVYFAGALIGKLVRVAWAALFPAAGPG